MDDWFRGYQSLMNAFVFTVMLSHVDDIYRSVIEPKLEKELGRPLTDGDWDIYRQELAAKVRFEAQNRRMKAVEQHYADRNIIRDFVWRDE